VSSSTNDSGHITALEPICGPVAKKDPTQEIHTKKNGKHLSNSTAKNWTILQHPVMYTRHCRHLTHLTDIRVNEHEG